MRISAVLGSAVTGSMSEFALRTHWKYMRSRSASAGDKKSVCPVVAYRENASSFRLSFPAFLALFIEKNSSAAPPRIDETRSGSHRDRRVGDDRGTSRIF